MGRNPNSQWRSGSAADCSFYKLSNAQLVVGSNPACEIILDYFIK